MAKGQHRLEFEVVEGWERLPEGWAFTEVAGVAVDSRERVHIFCRGTHPVVVFDMEGRFLDAWGDGIFTNPHGIHIDEHDRIFLVDNFDHTVRRFDAAGKLQQTIGQPGVASDTGFARERSPVLHAGGPFNMVTNAVTDARGDLYIADGYGNARIHKYSAAGEHLFSWGEPGGEPGQFRLPHGLALDSAGRVYVADRENSRIQIFSPEGELLTIWDWPNRPADVFIDRDDNVYVAEMMIERRDHPPHFAGWLTEPKPGHDPLGRVTIATPDGEIVARIGGGDNPTLPGNFITPHGLWVDPRGDLYVGEVTRSTRHMWGGLEPRTFQKFKRSR